jgi:carbamoyl-phosphate synthase large subunit
MGQKLSYNEDYTDGLLFLRYDSSICLNDKMEVIGISPGEKCD